jgi:hypothetical protein
MTARLVTPNDAVESIRHKIHQKWAEAICSELGTGSPVTFSIPLRPGISTGKAVERFGYDAWHEWHTAWRAFETQHSTSVEGVEIVRKPLTIRGLATEIPATLLLTDFAAATTLLARVDDRPVPIALDRARTLASSLKAIGANLTPATLKATCRLADADASTLLDAVAWLREHPDLSAWTARQLPVPGMHTKWLETHGTLLRSVAGRDVHTEVRPRPAVVHLTYVDPEYQTRCLDHWRHTRPRLPTAHRPRRRKPRLPPLVPTGQRHDRRRRSRKSRRITPRISDMATDRRTRRVLG